MCTLSQVTTLVVNEHRAYDWHFEQNGSVLGASIWLNKFIGVNPSATSGIKTISSYKTGITYKREENFVLCSALNLSSTVA